MKILKRILAELRNSKKTVIILVLLMVIASGLDVVAPFIAQQLIDRLVGSFSNHTVVSLTFIIWASILVLVVTVTANFLNTIYDYRLFKFVTKLEDELRFRAYQKYLSLHALFHHEVNSGQMIGRIDRGATGVYEILRDIVGKFILQPISIVVIVTVVLFIKQPIIALASIIPLPIFVIVIIPLASRIYVKEKMAHDMFEAFNREEYDVAGNVFTVKNFGQEQRETGKQKIMRAEARQFQYEAERFWKMSEVMQTAVATLGRAAVLIVGGYFVLIGRSTIGEFVLYITLQGMVYQPLWQLSVLFAMLRRSLARAERLFIVLDEEPNVLDKPGAAALGPFHKSIDFKNVTFAYRAEREVLKDITAHIPAGKMVALVGRSGSGKSTFVNMLLRSFDPWDGAVMIDGIDLRDVTQKSIRDQVAIVAQEVDLFSRTIAENIAYGRPDAPIKDIEEAAKKGYCHDFISDMPDGYRTMVGERGIKLSGGERQRIGIARAILRDPHILIMDEATSHLDTESERIVQKAMDQLMKGRTTVVIAHRLSTVLHADKILVFDKGSIVGEGTHTELLKTCEAYQTLYNLQFEE